MNRKSLLAGIAGLLIAGGGSFAMAQNAPAAAPTPAPSTQNAAKPDMPMHRMRMMHRGEHRGMHGHRMHGHRFGPGGAVIADLHKIERLYMQSGKASQLPALYDDVLARTQDARVRNYVYARLARAQSRPANTDAAIATLRKSLDENLTRLNQRPAQRPAAVTQG
jgi:hypothetical protein